MAARKGPNPGRPKGIKQAKRNPVFSRVTEPTPELLTLAHNLARLGLDDLRISEALGVSESAMAKWKIKFPAFKTALHSGKDIADAPVVAGLFEIAQRHEVERVKVVGGGEHPAQIVRYKETIDADFRAASHVLACRHPDRWGLKRAKDNDYTSPAEVAAGEKAVADLFGLASGGRAVAAARDDAAEMAGVIALLGLGKPAGSGRDQR